MNNGKVTLKGFVGSAAERDLARSTAQITGVADIDAEKLAVIWSEKPKQASKRNKLPTTNVAVAERVRKVLAHDPPLTGYEIKVFVTNGMVRLTGSVAYPAAKQAAENDAENTSGVRRVENGVATLKGTADNWWEYRSAEKNAKDGGARKVKNQLVVR